MQAADQLALYLERIGLAAAPPVSADGLATLQAAHRRSIAFENLDVVLGRPILIDRASAFDKLVTRRRGGYCFEQNRLFADMLGEIGFHVRPLLARVRLNAPAGEITPRTHVLLLVDVDGAPFIADAGFGGSFVPPLPLHNGAQARTADGAAHRLSRIGAPGGLSGEWWLERAGPTLDGAQADWQAQYCFHMADVAPIDLEQCSHWTATWPQSRFTKLHILSIALPDGFIAMTDHVLTISRGTHRGERQVLTVQDYRAVLTGIFGLELPLDDVAALPLFTAKAN